MKSRILIALAALALVSPGAFATELSYSFVQGNWANVEPDGASESGNGPMLDFSYGFGSMFHVVSAYESIDYDSADTTALRLGGGVHHNFSEGFGIFGEASFVDAEIDVPLIGTVDDNGYAINGGVRRAFGNSWEVNGGIEHMDIGDLGDDTLLKVGALYTFSNRYALNAGYKTGDFDTLQFGFRVNFGGN